ncbi:MAG: hypothetical protein KI788_17085 [Mameliella sp.]|nr:hypothetical protein [Mameliella sp.]
MNHYTFRCPVAQSDEKLTDCEERHSKMMRGKHREIEPEICRVAHMCWMCPVRSAFRASGGPWRKPENKPRWDAPRENAAKLPPQITQHAFGHTLPNSMDYARADVPNGTYNEYLKGLQGAAPRVELPKEAVKKPATKGSAIGEIEAGDYGAAITEAVAAEKRAEKPVESKKPAPAPSAPKRRGSPHRALLQRRRGHPSPSCRSQSARS